MSKRKKKNKQFIDNTEDIRRKGTKKNKKRANRHHKKQTLKELDRGLHDDDDDDVYYDYLNI